MNISPLLFLGGIGMVLLGITVFVYWKVKSKLDYKPFAYGAVFWAIAIGIKIIIFDGFLPQPIRTVLLPLSPVLFILSLALYYGLRTGILECVLPYFGIKQLGMKKYSFNEAVAFGLGFGCAEAVFVGAIAISNVWAIYSNPFLVLPQSSAAIILLQSENALLFSFLAIFERFCVIAINILASLLIFAALQKNKIAFLLEAVVLKTVLDAGIIAVSNVQVDPLMKFVILEVPVALLAFISFFGIMKISRMKVVG
jgi:uncharacterized membrane protein YhfC